MSALPMLFFALWSSCAASFELGESSASVGAFQVAEEQIWRVVVLARLRPVRVGVRRQRRVELPVAVRVRLAAAARRPLRLVELAVEGVLDDAALVVVDGVAVVVDGPPVLVRRDVAARRVPLVVERVGDDVAGVVLDVRRPRALVRPGAAAVLVVAVRLRADRPDGDGDRDADEAAGDAQRVGLDLLAREAVDLDVLLRVHGRALADAGLRARVGDADVDAAGNGDGAAGDAAGDRQRLEVVDRGDVDRLARVGAGSRG